MKPATTHARPSVATDQRHRSELGLHIYRLLKSNGHNARPVHDMAGKSLPEGGFYGLIESRPADGVRAEIGGTTLTVEITSQRHGEQEDPDVLRYACYDLSDFRTWFADLLQRSGLAMMPPATLQIHECGMFLANCVHLLPRDNERPGIRPDLRTAPMFHHRKGGKR